MKKSIDVIDEKIFVKKNIYMNKQNFINHFKVKRNSYLYNLYGRLYDYILGSTINLKKEYKKYYKKEYKSMREFLIEKYNLNNEQVENYCNRNSFYKLKNVGFENAIHNMLYYDKIRDIVVAYTGGDIYEN